VVHEYVALCLEVVLGDPWALGAVQGGLSCVLSAQVLCQCCKRVRGCQNL
jgi:F0F1-type ATP synthase assembly protein I